jgi:two-component SAPR family response regulator
MNSEEILTNANLYSNKSTNQLFCTTQEFKDDGSSKINIYSLSAPPVSKEDIYSPKGKSNSNIVIILVILLVIVSLLLFIHFIIKKRKRKKDAIQVQVQKVLKRDQDTNKEITITNSVILFGSFKVINRYEKDISYLFSPKVRQLFLLLLFSSNQKNMIGVTSELIYTTIWPDSTSKKATNLKNVMISQLRNILKDIDGLELIYSNGRFFIEFEEAFYCDYFSFLTQLEAIRNDLFDENSLTQLTKIISPGKFLQSINDECFDKVKKDFEYEVLKRIPNQIKLLYTNKDYAPIIPLTEVLFNIDSLNETAFYYRIHTLLKMKMTFKAKKQFNYFIINYNKIMGDNFPYTYKDVMRQIPDNLE